jgi:hypothetical protein
MTFHHPLARALAAPLLALGLVSPRLAEAQRASMPVPPNHHMEVLAAGRPDAGALADAAIGASRRELLDVAFAAVSALPTNPHVKNRCRGQEAVVAACLGLDQPRLALAYADRIANWRRGTAYADVAFYCLEHGQSGEVAKLLDAATRIAAEASVDPNEQEWRGDRVRARVARARALAAVMRAGEASREAVLDPELASSMPLPAIDFDRQLQLVDDVLERGTFDQIRQALEVCSRLYARFYEDAPRRLQAENRLKQSDKKLPSAVRIEPLLQAARFALDHHDRDRGAELTELAQTIIDETRWLAEAQIPLMARVAVLRHRAGDEVGARKGLDAAKALFDAQRDTIVVRAAPLRAIAEAHHAVGDRAAALATYRRAVEAGADNPNGRPRADDLCATCLSIAESGCEPDAELTARIKTVLERLGPPW